MAIFTKENAKKVGKAVGYVAIGATAAVGLYYGVRWLKGTPVIAEAAPAAGEALKAAAKFLR